MGIFDRMSKLIKSNANSALDGMQDASKEIDQLVLDMEAEEKRARKSTMESMAAEKLARARVVEGQRELATWERRAEEAVRQGDDDLAKQALAKADETRGKLADFALEVKEATAASAAQQQALTRLGVKLREIKARKGTIQAKVAIGKQQGLRTDSLEDFDRMAGKIEDNENQGQAEAELAEALGQTPRDAAVEAKLARLDGGGVEDRLAALKKKMEEK